MRVFAVIAAGLVASAVAVPGSSEVTYQGPVIYHSGLPPGMTSSEANALIGGGNLPYTVGPDGVKTYMLPNPGGMNVEEPAPAGSGISQMQSSPASAGSDM